MGLLDFLETPQGQALASGLATYAATARRGTPINNIGRGALGAVTGYGDAVKSQEAQVQTEINNQFRLQQRLAIQRRLDMQQQRDTNRFTPYSAIFDALDPSKQPAQAAPGIQAVPGAMKPQTPGPVKPGLPPGFPARAIPISYDDSTYDGENGIGMDEEGNFVPQGGGGDRPAKMGEMQYTAPTMPVSMDAYTKARDLMEKAKSANDPVMAQQAISMLGGKFQPVPKLSQRLTDAIYLAGYNPADYQTLDPEVRKQIATSSMGGKKANLPSQIAEAVLLTGVSQDPSTWTQQDRAKVQSNILSMKRAGRTSVNVNAGQPGKVSEELAGLTGDDLLSSLPDAQAHQVKALTEGRMAFPTGTALRTPYWQNMIAMVSQYDPSFDAVNYNARAKTRASFTSGTDAKNLTSINTAIGHLQTLAGASQGLDNSGLPAWNELKNWYSQQTGDPNVPKFTVARDAVANELMRVFRGTGAGSEKEIQEWKQTISSAQSPAQLKATVGQAAELLESRIAAMNDTYNRGMGTSADVLQMVSPKSRAALDVLRGYKATGSDTNTQKYSITAPNGKTYTFPDAASMQKAKKAMGL